MFQVAKWALLITLFVTIKADEEVNSESLLEKQDEIELQKIEQKQDAAQDRFVDLSVDVSYGLPQLGYVYNGLHLRGPTRSQKSSAKYVHKKTPGYQGPRPKRQNFQTNFDFQSSFDEIKQNFRPNPNNIELVLEETASPVPPTVRGQYVTPTAAAYVAETHAPTEAYQEPSTTQYVTEASISNQYHYPPYTPPKAAVIKPQTETFYIGASTKPPLHIKIKQDLQGLVGSMTNMFNGGQPKDSGVAQPHLPQISQPSFKLKMPSLPQAAGKPPLLEKLKLDILSLIPSNEASGYSAPSYVAPTTPPVAVYTEPEYYHPPASQSGSNYPKQGSTQREPLLNKFVKDFGIVNRWLARQTLEIVNDGQSLQLPFEIPEIPTVQKIKKRKDSVMKYIQAPDLSNVKNGSASS